MKNAQIPKRLVGLKLYVLLSLWDTNMGQGYNCVGVFFNKKEARRILRKAYQKKKKELLKAGCDIAPEGTFYQKDRAGIEEGNNNLYDLTIFERELTTGKVRKFRCRKMKFRRNSLWTRSSRERRM